MSLSSEHFDHHLTPRGWVAGTAQLDFSRNEVPIPADRLLTVTEHRKISHFAAEEDVWCSEVWRSPDQDAVQRAIAQFGSEPDVSPPV